MDNEPASSLAAAFRQAHYVVFLPDGDLTLRIGEPSPRFSRLMAAHDVATAAILTAFNPAAKTVALPVNQTAQEQLEAEAGKLGLATLSGQNHAPDSTGPAEPTVILLGVSTEAAAQLAARYEQLAFVFVDQTGTPTLLWKRGENYKQLQ